MTRLADKLADLSVIVGDIEARAEAFGKEQNAKRGEKIAELQSGANATRELIAGEIQSKQDQITSVWSEFHDAILARDRVIREQDREANKSLGAHRTEVIARRLETHAEYSLGFARAAIEEAELAVSEAIDARIRAENKGWQ